MIPTFARQIAHGGPVTVTDARMTRFFMSVEEAVQLVLQASVLSDGGGEIFMLEMGEPVRILDLAERMIRLSGLPGRAPTSPSRSPASGPGEKLNEELRTPDEQVLTTYHPYINRLIPITGPGRDSSPPSSSELRRGHRRRRRADAVRALLFGAGAPDEPAAGRSRSGRGRRPTSSGPSSTAQAGTRWPTESHGPVAAGEQHRPGPGMNPPTGRSR